MIAISVKQPWAALLVHGLKTIEIRRWSTAYRGMILIHASKIPDARAEAWNRVPAALGESCCQLGGIIGKGILADCITYRSSVELAMDEHAHHNDPSWFQGPRMYGFSFVGLGKLAFQPIRGALKLFRVSTTLPARSPQRGETANTFGP